MATTFTAAEARGVGTTLVQLSQNGTNYAVANNAVNILLSLLVANTDPDDTILVTVQIMRNGTPINLIANMPLPPGSSEDLIDQKMILISGDYVVVKSNTVASLDVSMSMVNITSS
jgi:hypothetical protein